MRHRELVEDGIVGGDLCAEVLVAAGQRPQGVLRRGRRRRDGAGSKGGASVDEDLVGEPLELGARLVGAGDDERLERDDRRGAALAGGVAGDLDLADHLDGSVRGFGHGDGLAAKHRPGCGFGV